MYRSTCRWTLLALPAALAFVGVDAADPAKPSVGGSRCAFLVACGPYDGKELRPLASPREDLSALAAALRGLGFRDQHIVQFDEKQDRRYRPDAAKIRQELKLFLENLEPGDDVIVALAGHAVQFRGEDRTYFCPLDARLDDRPSLLPFDEVYHLLQKCRATRKALLVDACRSDPRPMGAAGAPPLEPIARPQTETAPRGVAVLFSSSEGEEANEQPAERRGVFYSSVVKGLQGAANPKGALTFDDVARYAISETRGSARAKLNALQTPVRRGEATVAWVLRDAPPRPPEPDPTTVRRDPPLAPKGLYSLNLQVRRPADKGDFTAQSQRLAVEVFRDPASKSILYAAQSGAIAATRATVDRPDGRVRHFNRLKLKARKAGEADDSQARRFNVEVYHDQTAGQLVYVTDAGTIAVTPMRPDADGAPNTALQKFPLVLKVRKAGEADFTDRSPRFGVEIYQENATGNLLFLAENGALAVMPPSAKNGDSGDASWQHALEAKVRKPGAAERTVRIGVEVYQDPFSGYLVYISEMGQIAVTPARPPLDDAGDGTGPVFQHSLDLTLRGLARDGDEPPRPLGVEVYRDDTNGASFCISGLGGLAILGDAGSSKK